MSEPQYTIKDMVSLAVQGNPNQMAAAFDQAIGPKIAKALDDRKVEIAKSYFNPSQDSEEVEAEYSEEDEEEDNNTEASDDNEDTESATQEV